jgi:hypothetical protein
MRFLATGICQNRSNAGSQNIHNLGEDIIFLLCDYKEFHFFINGHINHQRLAPHERMVFS